MNSSRAKLLVLVALLGAWALIFGLRTTADRSGRPASGGAVARPAPAAQEAPLPRLKLELLDLPRPPYPAEVHNIFGTPPPPPPPVRPASPAAGAPVAAPPPPPPPPDPFVEEAKQLRFVGYLKSGGALTAFVTRGNEVHSLAAGTMLQGRYRVQAVTEEEVVLASPQGDKQVRIPITPAAGARAPQPAAPPGAPGIPGTGGAPRR